MLTKKVLLDTEEINRLIDEMARQISKDFPKERPLFVALLRGAAPFASKLMFSLQRQVPDFHPELDYMMVSTYGRSHEAGEPHIVTDLAPDTVVQGRTVVVIDDILDKGVTAHFVMGHMRLRGASQVRLAVLANKTTEKTHEVSPDYCGVELEDLWLVGMGLDDPDVAKEHARWQGFIEAKS